MKETGQNESLEFETAADTKIDSVEKYQFEPIQGYPMLHWKGKRPFRSTQYYPAQLKEQYGEPIDGWMNRIYWGDNLQVMSHLLKEFRGKINLIYIDPPFDSKAEYKKKITLHGNEVFGDQNIFEEKQYTDLWSNDEYLQFLYERLILMRELMSENGSIFVHCDRHKNHLIRSVLDEVFGNSVEESSPGLVNEIIWYYPDSPGRPNNRFAPKHDTILWYCKGSKPCFDDRYIRVPILEESKKRYETPRYLINSQGVRFEYTGGQAAENGKIPETVWRIPVVKGNANESEKYPTQKPESLLERIINVASQQGDIVFDCFMGSGTTQAVAMKLGRRFIGADINLGAIRTTCNRLLEIITESNTANKRNQPFSVYNVNHYDIFRNPVEAKDLLIEALEIQPLPGDSLYDGEKDGYMVKIMPINRIATRADLSSLVTNFDQKLFSKRQAEHPGQPVERIMLICMGHEPGLGAALEADTGYKLDVKVVDILRDKSKLEFKREAEAKVTVKKDKLVIQQFFPMNLLQKLSMMQEQVEDWRQLVETVMIDWNYDGEVLKPTVIDNPGKNELVAGTYDIPAGSGRIRVKITDLLSESLEVEVDHG